MRSRYLRRLMPVLISLLAGTMLFMTACGGSPQNSSASSAPHKQSGSIVFLGLVDYPMTFTALDMDYMYWVTITADRPEVGTKEYEGVPLSDIFTYVGVQPEATTLVITTSNDSVTEIALAEIASTDAVVTIGDDGAMNAIMPGLQSNMWIEDVVSMELR